MEATFTSMEYILLAATLLLSLIVGLYYALCRKQDTAKEYLHGGKNMNYLAVSLSTISSVLSGVTLISVPAEVYFFGVHYIMNTVSAVLIGFISYFLVTPVFYNLELTSIYQYLELRFDKKVKVMGSFLYTIQTLLYMPMVIYTPSLTVAQVTKINVHLITPVICLICIVYTVFGGIKAVIWTDALQFVIMLGSILTVIIVGVIKVGGVENIFSTAYETGRLHIDFDIDPTKRDTFWAAFLGTFGQLIALHIYSQGNVQKYLALRTYKDVKKTHIISLSGLISLVLLSIFAGLIIIAAYIYCDPLSKLKINRPDQLIPFFVMDVGRAFPGLAGVFVAGVISAGLSTLSAGLNSLAATMHNDFLKSILPEKIVTKHEATTLKILVLAIGIVCVALVYVVEQLGNLLPLLFSAVGITTGPIAGLFTLGLFMPKIGSKAALSGSILCLIIMGWFVTTTQIYKMKGWITTPSLPVYTNNCIGEISIFRVPPTQEDSEVSPIFKITHLYFTTMGILITILIAYITNCFTGPDESVIKDEYLSPMVHYFRQDKKGISAKYESVEQALILTSYNSNDDPHHYKPDNSKEINES